MVEPKVRFKRDDGSCYPAWIVKNFSESFDALNNNSFSRDMLNYDGGDVKNIHYGDILVKFGDICNIQNDNVPYVNDGVTIQKYAHLKDGDVILADTAEDETVGKAIEIYNTKNDVVISGLHTMACRPVEVFAPKYLGYYMNSPAFHDQLRPYMQGVKVTSISRSNIADAKLSFPKSSEEQQKIADFLSAIDEVISTSEAEVKNLETQKKAVMKKIFSQEVRFKRADGSEFPKWEEKTIDDVTDSLTGYAFESELFTEKGIRLLRGMNIKRGELDFSEDICKYWPTSEGLEKFLLQENDLIVQMDGALVGKSFGLVKSDHLPALLVQRVTRLRGDSTIIQLLYHILSMGKFDKDMKLNQTSTAVPHISLKDITGYEICIPVDLEEQRLIADFLSDFDEAIAAAKKELELWKELKKGLLQQMFV